MLLVACSLMFKQQGFLVVKHSHCQQKWIMIMVKLFCLLVIMAFSMYCLQWLTIMVASTGYSLLHWWLLVVPIVRSHKDLSYIGPTLQQPSYRKNTIKPKKMVKSRHFAEYFPVTQSYDWVATHPTTNLAANSLMSLFPQVAWNTFTPQINRPWTP